MENSEDKRAPPICFGPNILWCSSAKNTKTLNPSACCSRASLFGTNRRHYLPFICLCSLWVRRGSLIVWNFSCRSTHISEQHHLKPHKSKSLISEWMDVWHYYWHQTKRSLLAGQGFPLGWRPSRFVQLQGKHCGTASTNLSKAPGRRKSDRTVKVGSADEIWI